VLFVEQCYVVCDFNLIMGMAHREWKSPLSIHKLKNLVFSWQHLKHLAIITSCVCQKKKQSTREALKRIINEASLLGYEKNHQRNCVAIYIQHSII